jgi:hypothetical protein
MHNWYPIEDELGTYYNPSGTILSSTMSFKCDKCGAAFPKNQKLQRHLARKTPCVPIVDIEDLPDEKKQNPHKCKFCGRTFGSASSLSRHTKQACKIAPRNGDTSGMEKLYEHVLRKQEERHKKEMAELEKRLLAVIEDRGDPSQPRKGKTQPDEKAVDIGKAVVEVHDESKHAQVLAKVAHVDQSTGKIVKNTINVNVFGGESTAHITSVDVLGLLRGLGPLGEDLCKPSERLILSMAMLIYSDERHPENITCYLPNKKGRDALIHGESGWEVMPVSLTLSPMASKSVDELFKKQPWPGIGGIDPLLNLDEPTRILSYIAKHEGDLVGGAASPSSELRAIPIRNRDILEKVLAKLPKAGDQ